MKYKKYLFIFIVLLLCGCTVDYKIEITEDLLVKESISISESNDKLKEYGQLNNVVSKLLDIYGTGRVKPKVYINREFVNSNNEGILTKLDLNKNIAIKNYDTSTFFNYFYENSKVTRNGNIYTIYGAGFNYDSVQSLLNDHGYNFEFNGLTIEIKLPFEVTNHTADYVDEETNTYFWSIDEFNYNKKIMLEFNQKNYYPKHNLSRGDNLMGAIINLVTFGTVDGNKIARDYGVIIWVIAAIITILFGYYWINKRIKKNNTI